MPKIQEILAETRAFVETKKAEFTDKQGLAGQDPNTLPGAENDKPATRQKVLRPPVRRNRARHLTRRMLLRRPLRRSRK